MWMHW
jgi:hypothetical protein